jgi:hypothetical protein
MADTPTDNDLLDAKLALPQHVVHRSFVEETVVLNLRTGKYHGLNRTAGEMLEGFEKGETPRETSARLAREYGQDPGRVLADVTDLCRALFERELIDIVPAG